MDSNYKPPPESTEAAAGDFDDEKASPPPPNALGPVKPVKDWFTFENRCMVCGVKLTSDGTAAGCVHHLDIHCKEGVMKNWGRYYEQVKAHPVGFPGILLPRELQWSR